MAIPVLPDFTTTSGVPPVAHLRAIDVNAAHDALAAETGGIVGSTVYSGGLDRSNFSFATDRLRNEQKLEARSLVTLAVRGDRWVGPLVRDLEIVEVRLAWYLHGSAVGLSGKLSLRTNGTTFISLPLPDPAGDALPTWLGSGLVYRWPDLSAILRAGAVVKVDTSGLIAFGESPPVTVPSRVFVELVLKEEHVP